MASSSTNCSPWKYDVFLSFRGSDTRNGFVNHLFDALCRKQIITFIDENLDRGEEISSALLQTIEESYVSVVIFSENYAYSPWCLDELVKIFHCKKVKGQVILPVFYEIDPTDVQDLTGKYGDALKQHQQKFKDFLVQNWSDSLREIAGMSGFVSWNIKPETKLIEDIVNHISERLNYQVFSNDPCVDNLVVMESRINDVESLLKMGSPDVRILGIWGMAGIGKTTIATKVFERICSQFEGKCFVANVREKLKKCTLDGLQHEILSKLFRKEIANYGMPMSISSTIKKWIVRKKVLIVLDDVNDLDEVEFLIGSDAMYAPGSRIIVTSRDKQILRNGGADQIYEVKELKDYAALQLFLSHALKANPPTEAHMRLAKMAVKYAQGNPLAVKVLGSNLYNKTEEEWEDELEKLKGVSDKKIEKILKLSFDELDENEQQIFLDIACFFNLEDKDRVESVLDSCGYNPRTGISRLIDKSLITISEQRLVMHDLIQQMGRDVVRRQGKNPGERSRLWIAKDIYHVFKNKKGTASIESISLDVTKIRDIELSYTAFEKMSNLKFLEFYSPFYKEGHSYSSLKHSIHYSRNGIHLPKAGLSFLSDELRYLYWFQYPAKSLPSSFCPDYLVELHLIHSQVEELCFEHECLENLKVMDLSFSADLIRIPDLCELPKLEILCLKGCSSVVEIRSAIQYHRKLSYMDLRNCKSLCSFPRFIGLRNLNFLRLDGCSKLREFPEVPEKIRWIIVNGTSIQAVPISIKNLSLLVNLDLGWCTGVKNLPSSIGELPCLEHLGLMGCSQLTNLPDEMCNLKSLADLDIRKCLNLNELPENLGNLQALQSLNAGRSGLKNLPVSINDLHSLQSLSCDGCKGLTLPPLTDGLSSLKRISLNDCDLSDISDSIGSLTSLQSLSLGGNNIEMLPTMVKQLFHLNVLYLRGCKRLRCLPELPSGLRSLVVYNCTSLNLLSLLLTKKNRDSLWWFNFGRCKNLGPKELRNMVDDLLQRLQSSWPLLRLQCIREFRRNPKYNIFTYDTGFCVEGNEVPENLRYKNNYGSSLRLSLNPDPNEVMILAFCAVVAANGYHTLQCQWVMCKCILVTESGSEATFTSVCPGYMGYEHIELTNEEFGHGDSFYSEQTFLWVSTIALNKTDYMSFSEASFEFHSECEEDTSCLMKVIKCGVHLLHEDNDISRTPPFMDTETTGKLNWFPMWSRYQRLEYLE